ncbi:hypothetical protein [Streptomyces sp. NPDC001717]|uniref:hypothetical protein n=1 Tax=Streptomyces sp. NPDC001717 TaxID=3364604 RepID=UPI0036993EF0
MIEPSWLGSNAPHRVRCVQEHLSTPTPGNVLRRGSFCPTCAGQDPQAAWAAFQEAAEAAGVDVLEPEWLGHRTRHRVRCAADHETATLPTTLRDGGAVCGICAGTAPGVAWDTFRAEVEELGGTVLEPEWRGANSRHRIRCAYEHETAPYPTLVQQGAPVCRVCSGRAWDVFYVVSNPEVDNIKFGISSGTGRGRLRVHARDGYSTQLHLATGLPLGSALDLENIVRDELRKGGHAPVRGREYFGSAARPQILQAITAHHPLPEHRLGQAD